MAEIMILLAAQHGEDYINSLEYELDGPFGFNIESVMVHENYMSGGPGYIGPVFYITYDGGPEFVDVIIRNTMGGNEMVFSFIETQGVYADV
jgi:hypothetical protein